jgi:hypothetical protein
MKLLLLTPLLSAGMLLAQNAPAPAHAPLLGYTDTPIIPGMKWHVHDPARPHPPVVTPGPYFTELPPSDAIVLFDGKDLSHWQSAKHGQSGPELPASPKWKVTGGYLEVVPGQGDIGTKEKFGDMQLHIEWASPNPATGDSQGRGNSGVFLMGLYEIQVLDAWNNPTYADGQAGAVYGQYPPLANPARRPGEWNTYDIIFKAPRLDGDKVIKPAYVTVIYNGVLVQDNQEIMGPTKHRLLTQYVAGPAEDALVLQNHGNPVRFRNIWVRRLELTRP